MYYDPTKGKYVDKPLHRNEWKRGYRRKRLKGKHGRYYIRWYDDGRKTVSFQFYDEYKRKVTNTIELGDWEMCRQYHWWCSQRKGKRKVPAEDPFELVKGKGMEIRL